MSCWTKLAVVGVILIGTPLDAAETIPLAGQWRFEFAAKGTQFTMNGRPLFLRGTLECSAWPLTGYWLAFSWHLDRAVSAQP